MIPPDRQWGSGHRSAEAQRRRRRVAKKASRRGRDWRHRQGHRPGTADRGGRAHLSVPAVQHSLGFADPDFAHRRLSVRVEIFLRILRSIPSRSALDCFSGRIFASTAKRGDIAVFKLPRDRLDGLHQARDRPAGRHGSDDRRPPVHQRAGRASASGWRTCVRGTPTAARPGADLSRDAARRQSRT